MKITKKQLREGIEAAREARTAFCEANRQKGEPIAAVVKNDTVLCRIINIAERLYDGETVEVVDDGYTGR